MNVIISTNFIPFSAIIYGCIPPLPYFIKLNVFKDNSYVSPLPKKRVFFFHAMKS